MDKFASLVLPSDLSALSRDGKEQINKMNDILIEDIIHRANEEYKNSVMMDDLLVKEVTYSFVGSSILALVGVLAHICMF